MKIHLLSEQTIDQIAAGEVVEDPSSVVKELVENAVDAKATTIDVEIRGGGLQLICVSDDGMGMNPDDAILSLQRHATSKIRTIEDLLTRLGTMGFRGEALASIGAVSKLTLSTCAGKEGTRIEMEGGKVLKVGPCSRAKGTTVEVRSLFYNVPARKQFQKNPSANLSRIHKAIAALSLAYPEVAFRLIEGDKELFVADLHRENRVQNRINDVFGKNTFNVELEKGNYRVYGAIGKPQDCRPNRLGQYFVLNRRVVHCPSLSFAVKDGYGMRLPEGKFPTFVIYLDMPVDVLDVNVHPQKKEVRFRREKEIKMLLREAVTKALYSCQTVETKVNVPAFEEIPMEMENLFEGAVLQEEKEDALSFSFETKHIEAIGMYSFYLLISADVLNNYIPFEKNFSGVVVVDLFAAKKRIMIEQSKKPSFAMQQLLIPETVEVGRIEAKQIEAHLDDLRNIGLEMRPFGDNTFIIEGISPYLEEDKVQNLLMETIEDRFENVPSVVCNYVSKPKGLSMEEGCRMVEELLRTKSPFFCPHGNPTMIEIKDEQIEYLFSSK